MLCENCKKQELNYYMGEYICFNCNYLRNFIYLYKGFFFIEESSYDDFIKKNKISKALNAVIIDLEKK